MLRRLCAVITLTVLIGATPGMLPLFVAALAAVDFDHHVGVVGCGADTEVILKHDLGPATVRCSPSHHHGSFSRVLVFFARPSPGTADHVLHFSSGGQFLKPEAAVIGVPDSTAVVPALPLRSVLKDLVIPTPAVDPCPPAPPGGLRTGCTVVLLV
jgi:hypothetical protein